MDLVYWPGQVDTQIINGLFQAKSAEDYGTVIGIASARICLKRFALISPLFSLFIHNLQCFHQASISSRVVVAVAAAAAAAAVIVSDVMDADPSVCLYVRISNNLLLRYFIHSKH